MRSVYDVIIVGAGAAGLMSAHLLSKLKLKILIIEKNTVCGKKLSITGNGRANLFNLNTDVYDYNFNSREFIKSLLEKYDSAYLIRLFRELGVIVKNENGYVYPVSDQASTVVEAFLNSIKNKAEIVYGTQFKAVDYSDKEGIFEIRTDRANYCGNICILACGGLSGPKATLSTGDGYYIAERLGIRTSKRYQALSSLEANKRMFFPDAGIRIEAKVKLISGDELLQEEQGEVQLNRGSISGIPVLQLSEEAARSLERREKPYLMLDLLPYIEEKDFENLIKDRIDRFRSEPDLNISEFLNGLSNSNINEIQLRRFNFDKSKKIKEITYAELLRLCLSYKNFRIDIAAAADFQKAQATAGGVSLSDMNRSFETKKYKGLFIIGELLDVNGRCGGYNLGFAWISAAAACDFIKSSYLQKNGGMNNDQYFSDKNKA